MSRILSWPYRSCTSRADVWGSFNATGGCALTQSPPLFQLLWSIPLHSPEHLGGRTGGRDRDVRVSTQTHVHRVSDAIQPSHPLSSPSPPAPNPSQLPIPKKGNAKESSNYHTIALISHVSKVMLKIFQAKLQQYVNRELPDQSPLCPSPGRTSVSYQHHLSQ